MGRELAVAEKHSRVRGLRCFDRVHDMLCHGYPLPTVAEFIRGQDECLDISKRSLEQALFRYRNDILPANIVMTRMPHVVVEATKSYTDKLEELRGLDRQLEAMLYRFDLAHARERMEGIIDPHVDKINRGIRDLILNMHAVKMDLGISGQRQLGTLSITPERLEEIRAKYGGGAGRALADPVSRAKVLAVLNAARDASAKESVIEAEVVE